MTRTAEAAWNVQQLGSSSSAPADVRLYAADLDNNGAAPKKVAKQ